MKETAPSRELLFLLWKSRIEYFFKKHIAQQLYHLTVTTADIFLLPTSARKTAVKIPMGTPIKSAAIVPAIDVKIT